MDTCPVNIKSSGKMRIVRPVTFLGLLLLLQLLYGSLLIELSFPSFTGERNIMDVFHSGHLIFARSCPRLVMPSPQFFDGQALVSWSDPDITVAVPWYMGLMFRTRRPAGTLMQANAGLSSTINLMVRYHWTPDK